MDEPSSSVHGNLSPRAALKLAKSQLDNARKTTDPELAEILYNESRAALSRMEHPTLNTLLSSDCSQDPSLREEITFVLAELDDMLASLKQPDTAQQNHAKARNPSTEPQNAVAHEDVIVIRDIFAENKRPPAIEFKLPRPGERLTGTPQLAYCLGLLQAWRSSPGNISDQSSRNWLQDVDKNEDEINRITALAMDVIITFIHEGINDVKPTAEALRLVSVVDKDLYRYLLAQLINEESFVLGSHQLACLAQVIRSAPVECLEAADLIKVLELFKNRLNDIHQQSPNHAYELALSISSVIDAVADTYIEGLDCRELYQHLSGYVDSLKATTDSHLVYQAAYTYQALHHIPDDEAIWIPALQLTQKPITFSENARGVDVKEIIQKLQYGYDGLDGESNKESWGSRVSLVDYLKGDLSFECKRSWYPVLRTADALLRAGQFSEFKCLALEAPCRLNPAFQWGLCQLLGDLATNLEWDTRTRLDAIAFLEDILQNDVVWGQHDDVKGLTISILTQLASLPERVKQAANTVLQQWQTTEASDEQSLSQPDHGAGCNHSPLNDVFPSFTTPSLLDLVQDTPGIESRLLQVRKQRLVDQQDAVYVEPRAKETLEPYDVAQFSLMDKAKEFLKSDQKVFLLLGDPGSGKSTFSRVLERDLWSTCKGVKSPIPIYIDLSTISQSTEDLISECLRRLGFTEGQLRQLKIHRKFIVIYDEFDQTLQPDNVYTTNKLNQPGEWNGKLMVCCRTGYLGSCSLDHFQPTDQNSQVQPKLPQQAIIEPFGMDQVRDYIEKHVSLYNPPWKADEYLQVFKRDRCLQDLSRNPLLLSLTLVLPRLVDSQQDVLVKRFNKATIYDQIMVHWFERSKGRLEESTPAGGDTEGSALNDLVQNGIDYLKRLSVAIYKNQDGISMVEYSGLCSRFKQDEAWKDDFFSQGGGIQTLREASPLKCSSTKFQFIHPSILEYGLALSVYDPQEIRRAKAPRPTLARRGSSDSVMSFDSNDSDDETTTTVDRGPDHSSPLIWRYFVNDQRILEFLEDRVHLEPSFKQKLMAFIEMSKTEKKWRTAAANAITILVGAGISFNGADLRDIQVPRANLNHGMFESAQLQGADLRRTTFQCAWLYRADFSEAQMKGVQFGELPTLSEDSGVYCCAYSPDGRHFTTGLDNGDIKLYTTLDWKQIRTLSGHEHDINGIAFSTNGLMVSGSSDKTARLWNIEAGECVRTLSGHTDCVYGVAFSSQRDQVATGGGTNDTTVRIWDVSSGECQHILIGHGGEVWSVAYSPNGRQVASGSGDKTVRLWDLETGTLHSTLSGHESTVFSVAYSPQGHLIVSGSGDKSVRLWDVASGTCQNILHGHPGWIRSVSFSPLGNLIISGSSDKSVRVWDVKTGSCRYVLGGYNSWTNCVVFSPEGNQMATGSKDGTVRLWTTGSGYCQRNDIYQGGSAIAIATSSTRNLVATGSDDKILRLWDMTTGLCVQTFRGHNNWIASVAFSPRGDRVASGCFNGTARLWDVETGICCHTLLGHSGSISSVAFSPKGNLVASGSGDKTIRLWDAQTGKCERTINGHSGTVKSVAFSPTGDQIVSGSDDTTVRLWTVETGECICNFSGHENDVLSVAFSPTEKMIASCSSDGTVRLWDTNAGSCSHVLSGHEGWVKGVVFSPNGDQVASGGADKSVRVWSVASGQSLGVIRRFQGPIKCLAWCEKSDREYLATGEENGALHFCEVRKLTGGGFDVRQCWMSPRRLDATDATVRDVHGLTNWDKRLLKQRGAVDVPALDLGQV